MSVVQYKCPNCGASLEFNATKQSFDCEFCMSSFNDEQLKAVFPENENNPLKTEEKVVDETDFTEHTSLYSCPNCGAEIMADDTTSATFCYYCHGPVILSGRLSGKFRPAKVIPFKNNRENAIDTFTKWCKKKWFVPNDFRSFSTLEKISGVYMPFWLADCKVDADVAALGKRIRTWTSGDTRYTETKEYDIRRSGYVDFDGIPADGSSKTDDRLMEAIEPFDYNQFEEFSMSYLSGFLAEKYDVDNLAVFPRIKQRTEDVSLELMRNTMQGYDSVTVTYKNINIIKTNWHYMLLPVWLLTYKFKDKDYFFAMNGQTGKMAGIPPLSIPKMLLFAGILGAIAFGIAMLGGLYI